ncbi:MAG: FecR family protein [Pseudobacter sp.]|uniref:FecR family protein n=1 Tax=Pseudobacter sp. TaxID=2045420 RepID=UPI003F8035D2
MKERLHELFRQHLAQQLNASERIELMGLLLEPDLQQEVKGLLHAGWDTGGEEFGLQDQEAVVMLNKILDEGKIKYAVPAWKRYRLHWVAAAAILLMLSVGTYFTFFRQQEKQDLVKDAPAQNSTHNPVEIAAGKEGAILTLADGKQVLLDTVKNATVALQGGVTARVVNGSLVYEGEADMAAFNTMSTPKGRQFMLTLPDGTQVWLNAASSIRYPVSFVGKQRVVDITGEAYFEVAKNAGKPFIVNVNGKGQVEVLGTHFNVNAYAEETAIYTTLIEGRIRFSAQHLASTVNLQPGEQAELNGMIKVHKNVDVEKIMAWKNGLINFDGASFDEIMRQLERWYDIQVVYENNKTPNLELAGGMTRGVSLNVLLKQLGEMGVHYRLDGRTLIILP